MSVEVADGEETPEAKVMGVAERVKPGTPGVMMTVVVAVVGWSPESPGYYSVMVWVPTLRPE